MDLKDKKIIYELDKNSRASYQAIAKEVGLTKASVMNRVKKLQEEEIILQFTTIVDTPLLGYMVFEVHLRHRNIGEEDKRKILEYLLKIKEVQSVRSYRVGFDWSIIIMTKNLNHFQAIWWEISDFVSPYADRTQILILTNHQRYSRRYLIPNQEKKRNVVSWGKIGNEELNEIDYKIIFILSQNSRTSLVNIAKTVPLSSSSILQRIRSLEKRGIIKGYGVRINIKKMGYQRFRVMLKLNSNKKRNVICEWLRQNPNVVQENRYIGGEDIEFFIEVLEFKGLDKILNQLKENFGKLIMRINFTSSIKSHKITYLPTLFE